MLKLFVEIAEAGRELIQQGVSLETIQERIEFANLIRLKEEVPNDESEKIRETDEKVRSKLEELEIDAVESGLEVDKESEK